MDEPVRLNNEPVRIGGPVRLRNEPVRVVKKLPVDLLVDSIRLASIETQWKSDLTYLEAGLRKRIHKRADDADFDHETCGGWRSACKNVPLGLLRSSWSSRTCWTTSWRCKKEICYTESANVISTNLDLHHQNMITSDHDSPSKWQNGSCDCNCTVFCHQVSPSSHNRENSNHHGDLHKHRTTSCMTLPFITTYDYTGTLTGQLQTQAFLILAGQGYTGTETPDKLFLYANHNATFE